MNEENKHRHLHDYLKGLPKVKSRNDFEQRLLSRLRNVESEKFSSPSLKKLTGKKFSISDILRPSLVPAIGLTVILLVFIVYYINISQKESNVNQISQNEKPVTTQTGKDENLNKSNDSLISKNESISPSGNIQREKVYEQKSPEPTISRDYDAPPALGKEGPSYFEQKLSEPRLDEKKVDELKTEIEEKSKADERKEAPVMKKSGELKLKDGDDLQNYRDKENYNGNLNESRSTEQGITTDSISKADSTKAVTKGKKKSKKSKGYNDTIKIPAEKELQQEDSTSNKK